MPKCKSDYKLLSLELLELDEKVALLEDKIVERSSFTKSSPNVTLFNYNTT